MIVNAGDIDEVNAGGEQGVCCEDLFAEEVGLFPANNVDHLGVGNSRICVYCG